MSPVDRPAHGGRPGVVVARVVSVPSLIPEGLVERLLERREAELAHLSPEERVCLERLEARAQAEFESIVLGRPGPPA